MLLIDLGHGPFSREYFSDARGEFYEVQARAHNTVTVGERDHQIDARGEIIEADSADHFRWVAADAETACGDNVHFIRHVAMLTEPASHQGQMLVVVDELSDVEDELADLMWHTEGHLHLDAATRTGTISGAKAAVHFAVAACGEPGRAGSTDLAVAAETAQAPAASGVEPEAGKAHNILHVSAPVLGRLVLVSVFSRRPLAVGEAEPLSSPLRITEGRNGDLTIDAGPATLRFKTRRDHLHLHQVTLR